MFVLRGLILGDFRDGAHGAFLDALATADAGLLVHGFSNATRNLENLLGACINTDAATDALTINNYRMSHDDPFLCGFKPHVCSYRNLSDGTIPLLSLNASTNVYFSV